MAWSDLTASQTNVGSSGGQTIMDKIRFNFDYLYDADKMILNQGSSSYDKNTYAWIETINAIRDIAVNTESFVWTTYVNIPDHVTTLTVRIFGMTEDSSATKTWEIDVGGATGSVACAATADDSIKWYDAATITGATTGRQELMVSGFNDHNSDAKLFTFHRIEIVGNS